MFKRRHFQLMDATPGAAGGGDGSAAPAQPASDAGQGAGGSQPMQGAAGSILSAGKPADGQGAAPAATGDWLPEKFRVLNGDALDVEASARKLAESYSGLEKRVGSGDVPPKSAEEYALQVPDQFKDTWQEDDRFKAFRNDAHAAGLTQKQFDFVMGKYFTVAPELVQGAEAASLEQATTELKQVWKTDAEFTANVQSAYKAFTAFADPADRERMDEIGNNPMVLRMLAKIGKEMGEAGGIPQDAGNTGGDDIKALLTSEAAGNPKHPDHKATRARIDSYYAKKYGTAPI